jgi:hypothetical protein
VAAILVRGDFSEAWVLDELLHDVEMDLDSVVLHGDKVMFRGVAHRPVRGFGKSGAFEVSVLIRGGRDVAVEDDEEIGVLTIRAVAFDPEREVLLFEGAIPGRVLVHAAKVDVHVEIADEPSRVARFGR